MARTSAAQHCHLMSLLLDFARGLKLEEPHNMTFMTSLRDLFVSSTSGVVFISHASECLALVTYTAVLSTLDPTPAIKHLKKLIQDAGVCQKGDWNLGQKVSQEREAGTVMFTGWLGVLLMFATVVSIMSCVYGSS